jgi:uncharacterized protein DUF6982/PilZ domain-containing protein
MAPATVSGPDSDILDLRGDDEDQSLYRVRLASGEELNAEPSGRDRRAYQRLRDQELRWIRNARIAQGHGVSLVDLSAGGALIDSPAPLRPSSLLTLEISGGGFDTAVEFRVVRCQVGAVLPGRTIYRGACEFTRVIELPGPRPEGARVLYPGAFVGLDLAVKRLAESLGPLGEFHSLDIDTVRQALETLRARAIQTPLDPIGNPLAALLAEVVPALEHYSGLPAILRQIETELRRTVPQVSLRLTDADEPPAPGIKSILINVPGASAASALVSIDLPRGVVLNAWQSRVLRVTSRLIGLLQRLEPERGDASPEEIGASLAPSFENAAQPSGPAAPEVYELPLVPSPDPLAQTTWQKIVVRYAEGQILKGYTQDFSATRSQFSLWPSLTAAASERVIVPLARLKAVFFVRDFAGNPGYVERTDGTHPQHGRRIEVTLVDDEVIVGRTLSYRPDGHGFFVVPADPLANNIRVFVVSSSVRQVRFP